MKLDEQKRAEDGADAIINLIKSDLREMEKAGSMRVTYLSNIHAALREMLNEELHRAPKK